MSIWLTEVTVNNSFKLKKATKNHRLSKKSIKKKDQCTRFSLLLEACLQCNYHSMIIDMRQSGRKQNLIMSENWKINVHFSYIFQTQDINKMYHSFAWDSGRLKIIKPSNDSLAREEVLNKNLQHAQEYFEGHDLVITLTAVLQISAAAEWHCHHMPQDWARLRVKDWLSLLTIRDISLSHCPHGNKMIYYFFSYKCS